MTIIVGQVGGGQVGAFQVGGGADVRYFTLLPATAHTTGAVTVTAVGNQTTWSAAANPFSIVSGPGSGLSTYVYNSATSATFSFTVTAVSNIPIVISDGFTTFSFSSAPVAPFAPTSVIVADNHDGTLSVSFVAPVDNGGSAITSYTAVWSGGTSASNATSPITNLPGLPDSVAGTVYVYATNIVGNGANSAPSSSITPSNTNVKYFTKTVTFPIGTTIGAGLAYKIRHIVAGVLTDITGWITTGMSLIPNMTGSSTQPPGYSINSTVAPNNADRSFSGNLLIRNHSSSSVYVSMELNIQGTLSASTVRITKQSLFLPTAVFTTPGYTVLRNDGGSYSTIQSHTTSGLIANPEVTNGYLVDVTLGAGVLGIIVWDGDQASPYLADEVFFAAPVGSGGTARVAYRANMSGNL